MVDEGKNIGFLGQWKLNLTEESITLTTEAKDMKSDWKAIENISETEKHVFIFISAVKAFIIPKGAFENESSKKEFLEEVYRRKS
jgi:hypothetical protein